MSVIAVYNMKGGVGKTTTAINLSYLSAASGRQTLLWDLDPQAAASFAFRVRPRVAGFGRKCLEEASTLAAAIRATDHDGLDLLPADFAYRKLDRLLARTGRPDRVFPALVGAIGRRYDAVFLDCPPGISRLTEGVFASAALVVVPTIPTILSLRMLAWVMAWSEERRTAPALAALLSMVDARKKLHRRVCSWAAHEPDVCLSAHVPYASIVEQMTVRRMPLPVFAPADPATTAFRSAWTELQPRIRPGGRRSSSTAQSLGRVGRSIESLVAALGSDDDPREPLASGERSDEAPANDRALLVHRFDTDHADLEQHGCVLELRERSRRYVVAISRASRGLERGVEDDAEEAGVRIDARWAVQILSGTLSPLTALERRLGRIRPALVSLAFASIGNRALRRVESRVALLPMPDCTTGDHASA